MALLSPEMQPGARRVRGREKRNITLNTKLNRNEYSEVERHCNSLGLDYGEWLREPDHARSARQLQECN